MKIHLALAFIVFQLSVIGQDTLSFKASKEEAQNPKELAYGQFQSEMAKHRALQIIRTGHIVNPYWGISTISLLSTHYPFDSFLSEDKSCEGYELKWIEGFGPSAPDLRKGKKQPLCGFSGMTISGSGQSKSDRKSKLRPTQYAHFGTNEIGAKYIELNFMQSYPIVQLPSQVTYYFENPSIGLSAQDKRLLTDSTLSLFSNVWHFIPALNEDLSNLKHPELVINDSVQHVEEVLNLAKRISLEVGGGTVPPTSTQRYACRYRIEQLFHHDQFHSTVFDNEKSTPSSTLKGYKFKRIDVSLSPKEFHKEGYCISDSMLSEQQKGVYFYGDRYAIFYEFNLQIQQAGSYTVENVCLCEKVDGE